MTAFFYTTKPMKNIISEITLKYTPVINEDKRVKITGSESAYEAFMAGWDNDTIELYEEFKIMLLNKANEVLGIYTLSKGGISSTLVDLKLLFAVALKSAASGVIMAHNHPSGNLKPSEADKSIYRKAKIVAECLGISVLDNIILTKKEYYSFTDDGYS